MQDINAYLSRITSEHSDKPKFVNFVRALVQPMVDAQAFFGDLITVFDIDTAIGVQLDAVGQWVGRSRQVLTPISGVWFSLDTVGLGFDQGNWKGPFDPDSGLTSLDDDTYRLLLKAKIIMNSWDGSIPVAAAALTELFGNSPNTIISIEDNQDMTMNVSISGQVPSAIIVSLLQGGEVPITPSGVGVNYLITSVNETALFGFDTENATISGFDVGSWSGTPGTGPGPVQSFSLVSQTSTAASFSWVAPVIGSGPFTYQLQFQLGSGGTTWVSSGPPVSTTTGTVSGLQPNTTYSFQVFAVNSVGPGLPSNPITLTTNGGAPAQVTGLQITGTTANSIALAWSVVVGNQVTYQVQFRVSDPSNTTPFANFGGSITTTSETVTGLATATSYDFIVFAQNPFGAGPSSALVRGGTTGATPDVPQNLAVTGIGQNDVSLSWGQPITNNGPYTYTVQFAQNVSPITFQNFTGTITNTGVGGSCDVTGLTSGQTYLFRVFASNVAGNGPPTTSVQATVNQSGPTIPQNVAVSNVQPGSVDVSWQAAVGATTYQPQFALIGSGSFTNFGSPISNTTVTVTGLSPGTSYNFRVFGIGSGGAQGSPSPPVAAVTTGVAPGQVTGLTTSNATNSSISLAWNATTGTPTLVYHVQFRLHSVVGWTNFGSPIPNTNVTVGNLQSGQSYDFQVFAENDFGVGTPSATATQSTTSSASVVAWSPTDHSPNIVLSNNNLTATSIAPPVTNLVAGAPNGGAVTLTWTAANTAGFYGIRGSSSLNSGKVFVEFTMTDSTTDFSVGIASGSWPLAAGKLGGDANGLGIYPNTA